MLSVDLTVVRQHGEDAPAEADERVDRMQCTCPLTLGQPTPLGEVRQDRR